MFITVEGVEGSGKSTLISKLAGELERRGIRFLLTLEPGGCPLGQDLRRILLSCSSSLSDRAELFLFLADRAQHADEIIRPALAQGNWVICDRFTDSTIAYQGYGRGMDTQFLHSVNDKATCGLKPDLTFLLDLPAEEGLRRARKRNGSKGIEDTEGRFEAEKLAFHQRVRRGFLELAQANPDRFAILDARQRPEQLLSAAMKRLQNPPEQCLPDQLK